MRTITHLLTIAASLLFAVPAICQDATSASASKTDAGWVQMFDGKSFSGWKINENPQSWSIEDGCIVAHGERSHLFYVGQVEGKEASFKNFHFKADVKTTKKSNAGIYFHTRFQETGWPRYGFECQVNISHKDPKKSSGLYAIADVANPGVQDEEWYTQEILVEDRHIQLKINGKTLTDYTESEKAAPFSKEFERRLGEGTFALQAHDPESKVYFKNIAVKRLP